MIDLHTHILPGIDDGARDMADSLEMAEMALESGVQCIAATPHSNQNGRFENYYNENTRRIFREFCEALEKEHLPLTVLPGMEIFASEDLDEKLKDGRLIGLNASRYCLVEFFFDEDPGWMEKVLRRLLEQNRIPLIAHPERYLCVQDQAAYVYEWIQMGCLTQLNKGSVFGRFGRDAADVAQLLLEHGLVTCVASDAHSPYMRTTDMGDVRDYLEEKFGEEQMYRLLVKQPEQIIRDLPVQMKAKKPRAKRRFFW